MENYIQITIEFKSDNLLGILIAALSDCGFEGFEEEEFSLKAFIKEEQFDDPTFRKIIAAHELSFTKNIIAPKNWNEEWEKSFEPVIVADFCSIRASFHQPIKTTRYEIVITPKMSFGTGHHATTYLMIKALSKIDCKEKSVLDFGTGTGILAILSELCGAENVVAIDNDDWSIENAEENIKANSCSKILLRKDDTIEKENRVDIILANINKNTILRHFHALEQHLKKEGALILSGLLLSDYTDIEAAAIFENFEIVLKLERQGWICIILKHVEANII